MSVSIAVVMIVVVVVVLVVMVVVVVLDNMVGLLVGLVGSWTIRSMSMVRAMATTSIVSTSSALSNNDQTKKRKERKSHWQSHLEEIVSHGKEVLIKKCFLFLSAANGSTEELGPPAHQKATDANQIQAFAFAGVAW